MVYRLKDGCADYLMHYILASLAADGACVTPEKELAWFTSDRKEASAVRELLAGAGWDFRVVRSKS